MSHETVNGYGATLDDRKRRVIVVMTVKCWTKNQLSKLSAESKVHLPMACKLREMYCLFMMQEYGDDSHFKDEYNYIIMYINTGV